MDIMTINLPSLPIVFSLPAHCGFHKLSFDESDSIGASSAVV